MHTGDDTKDVASTPGPGRWRNPVSLPSLAVLAVLGIALWSAFAAWVWIS